MFEEIPPERSGFARVRARRFVLGPFVVGGGLVLALLGGSVAVAATVITASTIGLSSPPQRHAPAPAAHPTSTNSRSHRPGSGATTQPGSSPPATAHPAATGTGSHAAGANASVPSATATDDAQTSARATASGPGRSVAASASSSSAEATRPGLGAGASPSAASPSASGTPEGNAVVYITGYDATARQLEFRYATVAVGAGIGGSNLYSVQSTQVYTAPIGPKITVVSGGVICPPSGNACTADQLIHAAATGFFAEVALDPNGTLLSVIERDNVAFSGATSPSPSSNAAIAGPSATAGSAS